MKEDSLLIAVPVVPFHGAVPIVECLSAEVDGQKVNVDIAQDGGRIFVTFFPMLGVGKTRTLCINTADILSAISIVIHAIPLAPKEEEEETA